MQKVVTVVGYFSPSANVNDGILSVEREYPSLQKYLDEGYKIVNTINSNSERGYSITFILEKS